VGIATALALAPDLPRRWQQGEPVSPELPAFHFAKKPLQSLAKMAYTRLMLRRFGQPLAFWSIRRWPLAMLVLDQLRLVRLSRRYKKQMGL
jgi:hypothetical protein